MRMVKSILLVAMLLAVAVAQCAHAQAQTQYYSITLARDHFVIPLGNYKAYYQSAGTWKQLTLYRLAYPNGTLLNYLIGFRPADMTGQKIVFMPAGNAQYSQYYINAPPASITLQQVGWELLAQQTAPTQGGPVRLAYCTLYSVRVSRQSYAGALSVSAGKLTVNYTSVYTTTLPATFIATPAGVVAGSASSINVQWMLNVSVATDVIIASRALSMTLMEYVPHNNQNGAVSGLTVCYTRSSPDSPLSISSTAGYTCTYSIYSSSPYPIFTTSIRYVQNPVLTVTVRSTYTFDYYSLQSESSVQLSVTSYSIVIKHVQVAVSGVKSNAYPAVVLLNSSETPASVFAYDAFHAVKVMKLDGDCKLCFVERLQNNETLKVVFNYQVAPTLLLDGSDISLDALLTYASIVNGSVAVTPLGLLYNATIANGDKYLVLKAENALTRGAIVINNMYAIIPPFRNASIAGLVTHAWTFSLSYSTLYELVDSVITVQQGTVSYSLVTIEKVTQAIVAPSTFKYRLTVTINLNSMPRVLTESGFVFCLVLPKQLVVSENAYRDVVVTDTAYQPFPTSIEYVDNSKVIMWFRYTYPLMYNTFTVYILSGSKNINSTTTLENVFDALYTQSVIRNDAGLYSVNLLDKYNFILLKGASKFAVGKLNDYLMFYNNTMYEVHGTYIARSFPLDIKASVNNMLYIDYTFTVASVYRDVSPVQSYILQNYNIEKAEYVHFSDGAVYAGRLIPYSYFVQDVQGAFQVPKVAKTSAAGQSVGAGFGWGDLMMLAPALFVIIILALVMKWMRESRGGERGVITKV